jgi:hypothetical protein
MGEMQIQGLGSLQDLEFKFGVRVLLRSVIQRSFTVLWFQAAAASSGLCPGALPDKEFVVSALDLLSGTLEAIESSADSLVQNSNLCPLLYACMKASTTMTYSGTRLDQGIDLGFPHVIQGKCCALFYLQFPMGGYRL